MGLMAFVAYVAIAFTQIGQIGVWVGIHLVFPVLYLAHPSYFESRPGWPCRLATILFLDVILNGLLLFYLKSVGFQLHFPHSRDLGALLLSIWIEVVPVVLGGLLVAVSVGVPRSRGVDSCETP